MQIIGFHNPSEEYGFLSNWYPSYFVKDNVEFSSMEQYMMYSKAMCFLDKIIAQQILQTDDVARIKELRDALLNTGDAVLVECAVKDKVWGIGLSMTDPKRLEQSLWRGQNLLGFALMMARDKVK